jgi:tRNA(adenine34) deaminase
LKHETTGTTADELYMKIALEQAQKAYKKGEVPVGACVVHEKKVIAQSHNYPITLKDPTAHAEIITLREAAKKLGNYRLTGCTLYVTIEPCLMCTGAMVNARITRLVYGAPDPKGGAIFSRYHLEEDGSLDYPLNITQGVLKKECGEILQRFFKERRNDRAGLRLKCMIC